MENKSLFRLCENVSWDDLSKTIVYNDNVVEITPNMIKAMTVLIENIERPVSSIDIFFYVWDGFSLEYNPKLVRNLISSLRNRISCLNIENIYGGGISSNDIKVLKQILQIL